MEAGEAVREALSSLSGAKTVFHDVLSSYDFNRLHYCGTHFLVRKHVFEQPCGPAFTGYGARRGRARPLRGPPGDPRPPREHRRLGHDPGEPGGPARALPE